MINFNQAAGSFPKAPGAAEAVGKFLKDGAFNVERGEGVHAVSDLVFETRQMLADFFGYDVPKHVIFTSGVTAALNMFIFGWLQAGDHVICTEMEHNAVLRPLYAAMSGGVRHDIAKADEQGFVDPARIEALITPATRAVIVTAASNVSGTLMPLAEIGRLCRAKGLKLVVDSAQTAGSEQIDMKSLGIDALCFTGHKGLLAPQGIGGLIMQDEIAAEIRPFVYGGTGSQSHLPTMPSRLPDRLEAGTLNLPGIAGLFAALTYINETGLSQLAGIKRDLTAQFLRGVTELHGVRIIGPADPERQVAVVSLDFLEKDNGLVAAALAEQGILTRSGLHCAPNAHRALDTFPAGTVRFSFGSFNTPDEVDRTLEVLCSLTEA